MKKIYFHINFLILMLHTRLVHTQLRGSIWPVFVKVSLHFSGKWLNFSGNPFLTSVSRQYHTNDQQTSVHQFAFHSQFLTLYSMLSMHARTAGNRSRVLYSTISRTLQKQYARFTIHANYKDPIAHSSHNLVLASETRAQFPQNPMVRKLSVSQVILHYAVHLGAVRRTSATAREFQPDGLLAI